MYLRPTWRSGQADGTKCKCNILLGHSPWSTTDVGGAWVWIMCTIHFSSSITVHLVQYDYLYASIQASISMGSSIARQISALPQRNVFCPIHRSAEYFIKTMYMVLPHPYENVSSNSISSICNNNLLVKLQNHFKYFSPLPQFFKSVNLNYVVRSTLYRNI